MSAVLRIPELYKPKEQWSPSGLGTGEACEMAYFLRYVLGIREEDLPEWPEVAHLKRPAKLPESPPPTAVAIAARREAVAEYNRLTRRALGHAVHDVLARHYDWRIPHAPIDWHDRPGVVAIDGLPLLPRVEDCASIEVEAGLEMQWGPADDPLKVWGFADLIVRFDDIAALFPVVYDVGLTVGKWLLVDYKTTYDFDFIPLAEELQSDVAACFYALAIMVRENLDQLACRWVYFRTDEEKPEQSQAVDFVITREHAVDVLAPYEALALRLRELMRGQDSGARVVEVRPRKLYPHGYTHVTSAKHNPRSCNNYGGCVYHAERGGPCKPPKLSTSDAIAYDVERSALLQKRKRHQQALRKSTPRAKRATPKGRALPSPPSGVEIPQHLPKETKNMAGRFSQARAAQGGAPNTAADAGAATTAADPAGTAAPAARAPRAPKGPKAAPAAESPKLYLSPTPSDGCLELPESSPLYARALNVFNALHAE